MRIGKTASRVKTLKHNVWLLWFLDFHHFDLNIILRPDNFRERPLTNFTLKLSKVIRSSQSNGLFFNLIIYPRTQTINMNQPTIPLTIARRYHRIIYSLLVTQTYLTIHIILILWWDNLCYKSLFFSHVKYILLLVIIIYWVAIWFCLLAIEWL